jgi:hypothetical protein
MISARTALLLDKRVLGEGCGVRVESCDDEKRLVFGRLASEALNAYGRQWRRAKPRTRPIGLQTIAKKRVIQICLSLTATRKYKCAV